MNTNGFALVVGAGSGIGQETALLFAERGAQGVAFADKDGEAAKRVAEQGKQLATAEGFRALAITADVTDLDAVQRMVSEAVEEFGRIDYFVNSAGIAVQKPDPITDVSLAEFDLLQNVNCKGILHCLREVMKIMHKQDHRYVQGRSGRRSVGKGSIVNLLSLSSIVPMPNRVTYTASKYAAHGVNQTAAFEGQRDGIRVNAVCPGYTDTPMVRKRIEEEPAIVGLIEKLVPLKRAALVEEIGSVVHFLASPEASFVNGQSWIVDSGASLTVSAI